ncbi:MAG: (Fe-S)-binding protein [Candidatus Lokiarchaeota archaeon]|nr:(Fe-S)-binding protein [Candidatus Lokiarchaeota archaeon]
MNNLDQLREIEKELQKCVRCGKCRSFCPTLPVQVSSYSFLDQQNINDRNIPGWDTRTPRGRVNIALGLSQNKIKPNKLLSEIFFNCLFCAYCVNSCPSGVDVNHIIEKTRNYLLENGYGPLPIITLLETLEDSKNIFGLDQDDRTAWTEFNVEEIYEERINKPAEYAFFVGCQGSFKGSLAMISEGISLILDKFGFDFTILGEDEWCCGNPFNLLGIEDERFTSFAKHNVEKLKELKIKTVITTCPGCFRIFSKIYPKYLGELPFKVLHSSQFLADLIKTKEIQIENSNSIKIGFQDPCELGRHCGVFEEPRDVIKSISGSKLIELPNNRLESHCCGGGGLARAIDSNLTSNIAASKINEFIREGIEMIVTGCQACYENLTEGKEKLGEKVEIRDLNDLIADLLDLN